jgi:hypothetical protein
MKEFLFRGGFMPFKSQAQRAKFAVLVEQGKMKKSTFDEFQKATGDTKLPERIGPDSKPKTLNELRAIAKKKLSK